MTHDLCVGGKRCPKCHKMMTKRQISGSGWSGTKTVWVCPDGHTEKMAKRGGWQGGRADQDKS